MRLRGRLFLLPIILVVGIGACGGPNKCEAIDATSLSDCIVRGCDGVTAVRNTRVVYACRNQNEELHAEIMAGGGVDYEGPSCEEPDSTTLLQSVSADAVLGAFAFSHNEVALSNTRVSTMHSRAVLPDPSEVVTGTVSFVFACRDGAWSLVNGESALSLQNDRGKVEIAATCGAACDMCIADGYRCGDCEGGFVADSLRMVRCFSRIPYEN